MEFHRWGVEKFITTGSLMEPPAYTQPQPGFWVLMNNQKLLTRHEITLLAQCPGKIGCSPCTLQELQRGCQDYFAALNGALKLGRKGRMMWKLFISLLRVVLENVYLVPSGPSPSLSSHPVLWESPLSRQKASSRD